MRILIEENPGVWNGPEVGGKKMSLSITGGTQIFVQRDDGSLEGGGRDDLKVGVSARAWHTGSLLDLYPQVGTASDIVVLESPDA